MESIGGSGEGDKGAWKWWWCCSGSDGVVGVIIELMCSWGGDVVVLE